MHIPSIIEKKRDGKELSEEEISFFISSFGRGELADYQMSALAMAIFFRGMSLQETVALTKAMMHSGDVFEYPADAPRIVDKHSTGGVGDKVSIVLAPLLACDDVWVPMVSGRGLGITGGTLDKLESIPGFNVNMEIDQAITQLRNIGVVMMGQTDSFCPADRKLYALRDVTATVESQPLLVSSILSKKLAESLDALVLDVKFGSGAFMKKRKDAETLGATMQQVASEMGVETHVIYHPMDEPLGHAVGNALEICECIEVLQGRGPKELRDMVIELGEKVSIVDATQLGDWLDDGTAWEKFQQLVDAHGGNVSVLDDFSNVHPAPLIRDITSDRSGVVTGVDAETVGRASIALGAGRGRVEDTIDPAVGFDQLAKVGSEVNPGTILGRVHARTEDDAEDAIRAFLAGFSCE